MKPLSGPQADALVHLLSGPLLRTRIGWISGTHPLGIVLHTMTVKSLVARGLCRITERLCRISKKRRLSAYSTAAGRKAAEPILAARMQGG
jgi:hypothetical protein